MCPNTYFSRKTYPLSRYNVKGELDCFNCKAGVSQIIHFNVYKKKAIKIHVFAKKSTRLLGIFNKYKEIKY